MLLVINKTFLLE